MIKKILPVMIGAALVGGLSSGAMADVTAMGHIDTSMNSTKNELLSNNDRLNNLTCTTCSFGFKGSEDLGNGLSAIFKIDFQYDTTERNRNGHSPTVTSGLAWAATLVSCALVPFPLFTSLTVPCSTRSTAPWPRVVTGVCSPTCTPVPAIPRPRVVPPTPSVMTARPLQVCRSLVTTPYRQKQS